jgi:microcystin-dependent protein
MGAQFTIPLITVIPGQLIASALWNNEWNNVNTNFIPAGMDSYSDTDAQMQIQTDPYPGNVTSHASNMGGEIERIRFQIALILGTTYWYNDPATSIATAVNSLVPVGGVIDYPSATAPNANYHLADGTAISRAIYPTLFTLVGTTFGAGDGVTTFNIPNYTDKMSIAAGNLYALAATGGSVAGALAITDPGHTHIQNAHNHTDAGHTHSTPNHTHSLAAGSTPASYPFSPTFTQNIGQVSGNLATIGGSGGFAAASVTPTTSSGGGGTSGSGNASINNTTPTENSQTTGISGTAATLPPYLGMYKMIRVL